MKKKKYGPRKNPTVKKNPVTGRWMPSDWIPETVTDDIGQVVSKSCFKCHLIKPLEQFYKLNSAKDGRKTKCMSCDNEDNKEYLLKQRLGTPFANALAALCLENNAERLHNVCNAILASAEEGDLDAARLVLDRVEGKVTDKVEVKGDAEVLKFIADSKNLKEALVNRIVGENPLPVVDNNTNKLLN